MANKTINSASKSEAQKKNKSVTFRLSEHDFEAIKLRAAVDGIPYQTLISALVHQYALGKVKLNA